MNAETPIMQSIRLALGSRPDTRIFRNNVGKLQDPRTGAWVPFGLCTGSSDLIGWTERNGLAVFTAIEVKTATGRVRPEQTNFINAVRAAGGLAGIARSVEDAKRIIDAL